MKLKFLDARNCNALLPKHVGVPLIRELDNYLNIVNNNDAKNKGIIDTLIQHNQKTIGAKWGSQRYYKYHIDIGLDVDYVKQGFLSATTDNAQAGPIKVHFNFAYEGNSGEFRGILGTQYLIIVCAVLFAFN